MSDDRWCIEELDVWTRFACAALSSGDEVSASSAAGEADKMLKLWRERAAKTILVNPSVSVLEYHRSHLTERS